jgi:GNAT superfamily N-acetyltransferase
MAPVIAPAGPDDRAWIAEVSGPLGGPEIVAGGRLFRLADHPAFVARDGGDRVGLAVWTPGPPPELLAILALRKGDGTGSALLRAVEAGCPAQHLRVRTTNDNLDALRFYQRRGFVLVAVHRNAVTDARRLKPQIPLIGALRFYQRRGFRLAGLVPGGFDEVRRIKNLPEGLVGHYDIPIRDEIMLEKDLASNVNGQVA